MGSAILFISELLNEHLKVRIRIIIHSNSQFKNKRLTIVSGIHNQILKH